MLKKEQGRPTVEYAREMSVSNAIEITGAAHMHIKGEKFMHLRASQPGKNSVIAATSKAMQKVIVTGHLPLYLSLRTSCNQGWRTIRVYYIILTMLLQNHSETGKSNRIPSAGGRQCLSTKFCNIQIENVFLVFWLIVGLSIAIFTPPGVGKDEETHIGRAEQIAEGQLLPERVDVNSVDEQILYVPEQYMDHDFYGGETDEVLYELLSLRFPSVNEAEVASMDFAFPYWTDSRYSIDGSVGQGERVTWAFPNTSVNSPLCYAPYSLAFAIAAMAATGPIFCVILMRIFGVVAYGLIVRFAIKKVPICKKCLFFIAILPNSIAVATVVSADMMTNACSFLFLAYVLRFLVCFEEVKESDYVGLGISLCCLALLKMPYITFGLVLIFIFVANKMWANKKATLRIAIIGGAALALFFAWSRCTKGIETFAIWDIQGMDSSTQLSFIFQHPLTACKAIFAQLCITDLGLVQMNAYAVKSIPSWLVIFALIFFVVQDVQENNMKHNKVSIPIMLCSLSFLVTILIIVALYLTFAPVGTIDFYGVQSRYFIPVLFPILASFVMLFTSKMKNANTSAVACRKVCLESTAKLKISFISLLVVYFLFALWAYSVWL